MSDLIDITKENYDSIISDNEKVLIDFWAPWCGPCKMQTPILEKIASSGDFNVKIAKLNTDENPEIAQNLGIVSIPTLILFKEGKEVERFVGVQPEEVLKQKLS
jgi:thioredoxin